MENETITYPSPISYQQMADSMMMMWMEEIVTDCEYNRIMDKLNAWETKNRKQKESEAFGVDKMPPKCKICPYFELAKEPYYCGDCTSN